MESLARIAVVIVVGVAIVFIGLLATSVNALYVTTVTTVGPVIATLLCVALAVVVLMIFLMFAKLFLSTKEPSWIRERRQKKQREDL